MATLGQVIDKNFARAYFGIFSLLKYLAVEPLELAMSDPLQEQVLSSKIVYRGKFLQVVSEDVVVPGGHKTYREFLRHPGAAMMIPLFEDGTVLLERQWRHPLRRAFLEFPAGKLNGGEAPLACAKRELEEETGYRAGRWEQLFELNNAIGYSDEKITVFLARDLEKCEQHLDEGEVLELIRMPWTEVLDKVLSGEITDVKTMLGAFWLEKVLKR